MTKCVFCGTEAHFFQGVNLIKNDGVVDFYCSQKCIKNALKLGRDKRKVKWTEAYKLTLKKMQSDEAKQKEKEAHLDKLRDEAKVQEPKKEKKAKK
jgi:large subunit ribosomal protein L24e